MSGQQIGTLVGAVVGGVLGTYVFPGVGTFAGASIGGAVGGLAGTLHDTTTAPDSVNQQQRLSDLTITTSTLGVVIPQIWGQWGNLAGNIFWATSKVAHEHREEQEAGGGKGGGPSQITISFTYTMSFAAGLCDTNLTGPMSGLSRIWRNGTLIYDRQQNGTLPDGITFYGGSTTQTADPTMEADKGVGNVPGYRRLCYVVHKDDNLGTGGQTNNYTYEVYQDVAGTNPLTTLAISPVNGAIWVAVPAIAELWQLYPDTRELAARIPLPDLVRSGYLYGQPLNVDADGIVWVAGIVEIDQVFHDRVWRIDPNSYNILTTIDLDTTMPQTLVQSNLVFSNDDAWLVGGQINPTEINTTVHRIEPDGTVTNITVGNDSTASRLAVGDDGHIWMSADRAGEVTRIDPSDNSIAATVGSLGVPYDLCVGADGDIWVVDHMFHVVNRIDPGSNTVTGTVPVGDNPVRIKLASDGFLWVACEGSVVSRVDPDTETAEDFTIEGITTNNATGDADPFNELLAPGPDGSMWVLSRDTNTATRVSDDGTTLAVRVGTTPICLIQGWDDTVWVSSFAGHSVQQITDEGDVLGLVSENSLDTVVTTLCGAAGLTAADLDLTDLPDALVNMALVSMQAVRAPLQQLAQGYRFYAIESGQHLKFREQGSGPVVVEIVEDDLDAEENASPGQGLLVDRLDPAVLPTQLYVTYTDPAQNYQSNTQPAQLALDDGSVEQPHTINLTIAIDADQAKQMAEETLLNSWIQRDTIQSKLGRKYGYLEPGDRIQITARGLIYPMVITETSYGRPGLLEFTALTDAAFTRGALQSLGGSPSPGAQPLPSATGATTGYLLNLPALNSSDQLPRYHVAYVGESSPWPGGVLYRSIDDEATYQQVNSGALEGFVGTVASATPDANWHVIDDTTVITVVFPKDTMTIESVSDDVLYAGNNLVYLSNGEVVGIGTAELVSERTYELSHLLRGRRGTEWAVSTHGTNETLVRLDASVRSVSMNLSDRDIERDYKTVTAGGNISDVTGDTFTPVAENLRPWTTAGNSSIQDGADFVFYFYMRSRFNGPGNEFDGISQDADWAGFRIIIYEDNTYAVEKRITLTDGGNPLDPNVRKEWRYTEAMQIEDFGSAQSTVFYRVEQVANNRFSRPVDEVAA